jgi:tungstate transport system ATP-binding protein
LSHHYNGFPALEIDSLSILPNTITGFIGPNGSGKSTLLKLLAFINKPSKGRLFFKGKLAEPFSERVRFQVTMLSQEPYLMKRSVYKNIAYGLKLRGDSHNIHARVYDALTLVGLRGDRFAYRKWYELSGGETQRVALAARLILKPEVLLLDEPTASIDAASAQIIKDTVLMVRKKWGTTLIIASHDWEWLYDICDDVKHLFRGRVFGSGRENFIFGPWQKQNDNRWVKSLLDGQLFVVSKPDTDDGIAIIDPENMLIAAKASRPTECTIRGVVTRLVLERGNNHIIAVIQVSNQTFTAKLSRDQARDLNLYPGMNIRLTYDTGDVHWY